MIKQENIPDNVLLDLTDMNPEAFKWMSRKFKKKITSLRDVFTKLKPGFYKSYGKVGYKIIGKDGVVKKIVKNRLYLKDAVYRNRVNRVGVIPSFKAKINLSLENTVNINSEVNKFKKENHIKTFSKYRKERFLRGLKRAGISKSLYKVMKSSMKKRVKDGESSASIQKSMDIGIRFAVLQESKIKYVGKMCRLTTTGAKDPDESHVQMEWIPMPCEEAFQHASRPGCQHNVEVMVGGLLN